MDFRNKTYTLTILLFVFILFTHTTEGAPIDSLPMSNLNLLNNQQDNGDSAPILDADSFNYYKDPILPNNDKFFITNDSVSEVTKEADTLKKKNKKEKPSLESNPESYHARQAAKWAILPGGGQIYNKKWWKVPIAWSMIAAGGYFIYSSASNMRTYNQALDLRNSGQPDQFQGKLSEQQIIVYRNHYRRNLQLSAFGTVGLWTLTILDAVVDAHLKTYNISDDLSIKFKPKVLRVYNNSVPSLTITLFL
ncbi:MAG TPA: DUF5683 domain-containing protein [Chitinophagales bacterium]|nr:DUF5683 domain-containing protein [Chitinophagales bacterium]